jgi:hypothetical protein
MTMTEIAVLPAAGHHSAPTAPVLPSGAAPVCPIGMQMAGAGTCIATEQSSHSYGSSAVIGILFAFVAAAVIVRRLPQRVRN